MPFYTQAAKERQGARTDLADIVEKIPPSKARDEAGKQHGKGQDSKVVEKIPQAKQKTKARDEAGKAYAVLHAGG